ncbi:MAG: hypothetical protein LBV67_00670, partial [Streptococcaceae bacterium]|nr:hypothetical protein [Streptococcaceae bacterium]
MQKNMCSQTLIDISISFKTKIFFVVLLAVIMGTDYWRVFSQGRFQRNVYDYISISTLPLNLFYVILPIFLLLLLVYFSAAKSYPNIQIRFQSRRSWFWTTVLSLFKLATAGTVTFFTLIVLYALPTFSFQNHWSDFMKFEMNMDGSLYQKLALLNPFLFSLELFLLIICLLFTSSLIFLTLFILTRKPFIAFFICFVLSVINVGIHVGGVEQLYPLTFWSNVHPVEYNFAHHLDQTTLPITPFFYWVALMVIFVFVGWFFVNRGDLELA